MDRNLLPYVPFSIQTESLNYELDLKFKEMKGLIIVVLLFVSIFNGPTEPSSFLAEDIEGAWELLSTEGVAPKNNVSFLVADGYAFYSDYNIETKTFNGSMGGVMSEDGDGFNFIMEYSSWDAATVGSKTQLKITFEGDEMNILSDGEGTMIFKRIDNGEGEMFGAWRITDRMRDGTMTAMRQGSRKTIKMLTGTRFQWVAFDPESKSFSGTGGGTYTFKDGKYTETIEFHSRNSDRVGAVLPFDYKIDGNKWDHSGLSSTGNPIREIWTRQN